MKAWQIIVGMIALLIIVVVVQSIGSASHSASSQPTPTVAVQPTPTAVPQPTATPDAAYKLASIQDGYRPSRSDPLVGKMRRALSAMEPHCKQSADRLAALTDGTHVVMARSGVTESDLSILTHVGYTVHSLHFRTDCQSVFAAYATLRTSG